MKWLRPGSPNLLIACRGDDMHVSKVHVRFFVPGVLGTIHDLWPSIFSGIVCSSVCDSADMLDNSSDVTNRTLLSVQARCLHSEFTKLNVYWCVCVSVFVGVCVSEWVWVCVSVCVYVCECEHACMRVCMFSDSTVVCVQSWRYRFREIVRILMLSF